MQTTTRILLAGICFSLLGLLSCQGIKPVKTPDFKKQNIDSDVQIGYGLAIGDVDGDQQVDILLADKKQFVWYKSPEWQRFVMLDSLTDRDNVCIAARDLDGDGKVEVAVGAQWNPGETGDKSLSGSVHYLVRPENPEARWSAIPLYHEPTIHRMRWLKTQNSYQLAVLPLHGVANEKGEGVPVNLLLHEWSTDLTKSWNTRILTTHLHMTHNMDIVVVDGDEQLLIGGKEGAVVYKEEQPISEILKIKDHGFGEIRVHGALTAGIQPLHGNELVVYKADGSRVVLADDLAQGHALAWGDFLDRGYEQLVVGWRNENARKEIGIKLFIPADPQWTSWESVWVDKNGMACEDLKVADLNGDGKLDIVAAGRSTHNLAIYWNQAM